MRFTVAEIAEISPTCSIMEAMAIGAIARIEVRLNLQRKNFGTPTIGADATPAKLRIALPSAFGHSACIHDQGSDVRNNDTHQNRDNTEHSNTPDIKEDNGDKCDQCKDPVLGCVVDSRRSKAKSDTDDDWSCNNRWKVTHNTFNADQLDDQCKHKVKKTCNNYAATCIRKLFTIAHIFENTGIKLCNCGKSSQKCER